ncbi:hypothetical protein E2C01_095642 [Portunus trituberculatus]|uniref:Uncharacterized protein n=1 Tax=Portunus trituberculatus TaxID=210409 RepID=A0A5B7JZX4_PORTR|nr:hypothetical protein [Portunus trituberculatus]
MNIKSLTPDLPPLVLHNVSCGRLQHNGDETPLIMVLYRLKRRIPGFVATLLFLQLVRECIFINPPYTLHSLSIAREALPHNKVMHVNSLY